MSASKQRTLGIVAFAGFASGAFDEMLPSFAFYAVASFVWLLTFHCLWPEEIEA